MPLHSCCRQSHGASYLLQTFRRRRRNRVLFQNQKNPTAQACQPNKRYRSCGRSWSLIQVHICDVGTTGRTLRRISSQTFIAACSLILSERPISLQYLMVWYSTKTFNQLPYQYKTSGSIRIIPESAFMEICISQRGVAVSLNITHPSGQTIVFCTLPSPPRFSKITAAPTASIRG